MSRNEQVIKMKKERLTNITIANRLNISVKTVQRILKKHSIKIRGKNEPEVEKFKRDLYLNFESGGKVAERFGISRQAVLKWMKIIKQAQWELLKI